MAEYVISKITTPSGDICNLKDSNLKPIVKSIDFSETVTINDAAAMPVKDITIAINPVQSGSGDPSPTNVRPISGWTGANVVVSPTTSGEDGTTYPISWQSTAGTVYGGTLDVTTGLLTVTYANIASYNGETLPSAWISSIDVYSAGGTPTTGAQVVYELTSSITTYQLTPTEVMLLAGTNNVWADTGEMRLTYGINDYLGINNEIQDQCSKYVKIENMPTVPVQDVQVNGTSVVSDGVANVPVGTTNNFGVVRAGNSYGIQSYGSGNARAFGVLPSTDAKIKAGTENYQPVVPSTQHAATFYGLAKAAGDSTQSASSNAVGTYTDEAKAKIQAMLGFAQILSSSVEASSTASTNHLPGSVFAYNGALYKADETIASGATIVPGTNCHETTVEAEILTNFSVKTGNSVPDNNTVADFVGQLYNNTGNKSGFYICTAIANGVYTWRRVFISNDTLQGINLSYTATKGEATSILIGNNSGYPNNGTYGTYTIAIGAYSKATSSSIAIGNTPTITASGVWNFETIQLGSGTNSNSKTFQVWNYRLLESDGTIPPERITSANWTDAQRLAVLASLGTAASFSNENSSTASTNHSVGSVFSHNGSLYKATDAIASGTAITPGTNCTVTTVDELIAGMINDNAIAPGTTWSSQKIEAAKANKEPHNYAFDGVDLSTVFADADELYAAYSQEDYSKIHIGDYWPVTLNGTYRDYGYMTVPSGVTYYSDDALTTEVGTTDNSYDATPTEDTNIPGGHKAYCSFKISGTTYYASYDDCLDYKETTLSNALIKFEIVGINNYWRYGDNGSDNFTRGKPHLTLQSRDGLPYNLKMRKLNQQWETTNISTFIGDGETATFTIDGTVGTQGFVFVDGVRKTRDTDFKWPLNNNTITFNAGKIPANGAEVKIEWMTAETPFIGSAVYRTLNDSDYGIIKLIQNADSKLYSHIYKGPNNKGMRCYNDTRSKYDTKNTKWVDRGILFLPSETEIFGEIINNMNQTQVFRAQWPIYTLGGLRHYMKWPTIDQFATYEACESSYSIYSFTCVLGSGLPSAVEAQYRQVVAPSFLLA